MKKMLLILLVLIAVPLYAWNAYILFANVFSHTAQSVKPIEGNDRLSAMVTIDQLTSLARPVSFSEHGRNPFIAYKELPKPALKAAQVELPKPKAAVPVPAITITGIMWNPTSPLVMLKLPDGSSTAARAGQDLGEATVKKIEKNRVLFKYAGGEYWVER